MFCSVNLVLFLKQNHINTQHWKLLVCNKTKLLIKTFKTKLLINTFKNTPRNHIDAL